MFRELLFLLSRSLFDVNSNGLADFINAKTQKGYDIFSGYGDVYLFQRHFEDIPFIQLGVRLVLLPYDCGARQSVYKLFTRMLVFRKGSVGWNLNMTENHFRSFN